MIGKVSSIIAVVGFSAVVGLGGEPAAEIPLYRENFDLQPAPAWRGGGGEKGGKSTVAIVPKTGRDGSSAVVWKYDFSQTKPTSCVYVRCRAAVKLPERPQRFSLWVYGDNSGLSLLFRIQDATGRTWQQGMGKIDWDGWRRLECRIEAKGYAWGGKKQPDGGFVYPLTLVEFLLDYSKPGAAKVQGELRLDDFTVYADERAKEEF